MVVVDVHGADLGQFDTLQIRETSVGDVDSVGLRDTSSEVERLECWKGNPFDRSHTSEVGEVERAKNLYFLQVECAGNCCQLISAEGCELRSIDTSQVTIN